MALMVEELHSCRMQRVVGTLALVSVSVQQLGCGCFYVIGVEQGVWIGHTLFFDSLELLLAQLSQHVRMTLGRAALAVDG